MISIPQIEVLGKTRQQNRYPQEVKAEALAMVASGKSPFVVSEQMSLPRSTVNSWTHGVGVPDAVKEAVQERLAQLADRLQEYAEKGVEAGLKRNLDDIPVNQLFTSIGIAIDKAQLLRGQPTSIKTTANITLDVASLAAKVGKDPAEVERDLAVIGCKLPKRQDTE